MLHLPLNVRVLPCNVEVISRKLFFSIIPKYYRVFQKHKQKSKLCLTDKKRIKDQATTGKPLLEDYGIVLQRLNKFS